MPINLVAKGAGNRGSIPASLADSSSNLDGTFANPAAFSGALSANTARPTADFAGLFTTVPNRTGAIATTLGGFTSAITSSDEPYDLTAGGTRTVPFTYSWPTAPTTTNTVNVSSASAFNSAAATDGNRIVVTGSFTGNVNIQGDDIDVLMDNAHTINGTLTIGSFVSPARVSRVRWTGGNFINSGILLLASQDLMFNDVFFNTDANISSEGLNDFRGLHNNSSIAGIDRVALINSTIYHINSSPTGQYAIYDAQSDSHNLIFANLKVRNANGQTVRIINQDKHIVVDSVFNDNGTGANGYRIHGNNITGSDEVYIADSMIRGVMLWNGTQGTDGPQITNGVLERVTRYAPDGIFAYDGAGSFGNSATVNDSPLYQTNGDGVTEAALTDGITGSNNIQQPWDGSTVPDYSGVGAQR